MIAKDQEKSEMQPTTCKKKMVVVVVADGDFDEHEPCHLAQFKSLHEAIAFYVISSYSVSLLCFFLLLPYVLNSALLLDTAKFPDLRSSFVTDFKEEKKNCR